MGLAGCQLPAHAGSGIEVGMLLVSPCFVLQRNSVHVSHLALSKSFLAPLLISFTLTVLTPAPLLSLKSPVSQCATAVFALSSLP